MKKPPSFPENDQLLRSFLREDIGTGDVTSRLIFLPGQEAHAQVVARETLVFCGGPYAERIFHLLDPDIRVNREVPDGEEVEAGRHLIILQGKVLPLLAGERVALNLLQRLSGISTLTARLMKMIEGKKARLRDTRKTTPGLRELEKYAVRIGGGENHRIRLDDGILIKTNHIRVAGGVREAYRRIQEGALPSLPIEIEVQNLDELEEAVQAGATVVLLDNMSPDDIRQAVAGYGGKVELEVSGGVTEGNISALADTGVDFLSAGAVTHSARWMNIAMEVNAV